MIKNCNFASLYDKKPESTGAIAAAPASNVSKPESTGAIAFSGGSSASSGSGSSGGGGGSFSATG